MTTHRLSLAALAAALGACGTPVAGIGGPPADVPASTDLVALDAPTPDLVAPDVVPLPDVPAAPDVLDAGPPPTDTPATPDLPAPQDVVTVTDTGPAPCTLDAQCGAGRYCDAGACRPQACTPGARQCLSPTRARTCDPRGASVIDADCPSSERCVDGRCEPIACTPGSTRCADAFTRSVCSVDGQSQTTTRCATGQRCEGGACVAQTCTPGSARCASSTRREVCDTIGAAWSGSDCASAANATPSCASGACGFTCAAGFGDCDGMSANGCEADTQRSAAHCGACGRACASGAVCEAGTCRAPTARDFSAVWGAGGEDRVNEVAVDADGNVTVIGTFQNTVDVAGTSITSAGGIDAVVASFSPTGGLRWVQRIGSSGNDTGMGVTVDAGGNVYATGGVSASTSIGGTVIAPADGASDTWVASWTRLGVFRWARGLGGSLADQGLGLTVTTGGELVVGGNFNGTVGVGGFTATTAGMGDVFVMRLAPGDGTPLGIRSLGGAAGDFFGAVAAAPTGGVALGMHSASSPLNVGGDPIVNQGSNDAVVLRLGPDLAFRRQLVVSSTSSESIAGVGVDGADNVYFGGPTAGTSLRVGGVGHTVGTNDSFIGSFGPTGALRWFVQVGASLPASAAETVRGLAVRPDGTSYAIGTTNATTFAAGGMTAPGNGVQSGFVLVTNASGAVTSARVARATSAMVPLGVAVSDARLVIGGEFATSSGAGGGTFEGQTLVPRGAMEDAFVLSVAR